MADFNIYNVIKYYKELPHQKKALDLLNNFINTNPAIVNDFFKIWRNGHSAVYDLYMTPTDKKDRNGLIIFNLDLRKNEKRIDRVSVRSGSPNHQILAPAENDFSGSLRPIPEGRWIVGAPEKSPVGSWGPGLGEWWIELTPIKPKHNRKHIGIHIDANIQTSPGSAGCIVTLNQRDMEKIIQWIVDYKVTELTVNHLLQDKLSTRQSIENAIKQHAKKAIGYAEGNLDIYGNPTNNYYGHTDPGNNRRNLGAFSYQGYARSAEEADAIWLNILLKEIPNRLDRILIHFEEKDRLAVILNVCDLYTQAPAAVVDKGGLIEIISNKYTYSDKEMIEWRVQSFYDPVTKKLMAAGFGNNPNRLRQDQKRRVEALRAYLKTSFR